MSRKLAVKRLTASDLTFFVYHYQDKSSINQKAIDLNPDIIEELSPVLKHSSLHRLTPNNFIGVDVFIYGPGLAEEYNIQRKIMKTFGAQIWKLGDEYVANPENDPYRFNALAVNDFVFLKFDQKFTLVTLKMAFIAKSISKDKKIHELFDIFLGTNRSMATLTPAELETVIADAGSVADHPIYRLTLDTEELSPEVEDIVLGGSGRRTRTVSWSSSRKISRDDLQKAKESADSVGLQGEQQVNQYLQSLKTKGTVREFEWASNENAISPYDFWVSYDGATKILIDVKSTQGDFERVLHISLNELLRMREGPEKYAIYRVFNVKESTAQLRIVEDLGSWANQILQVLNGLPQGISPDSISVSPTALDFGSVIDLKIEDQTEE